MPLVEQAEKIKREIIKRTFPIIWGKSIEEWTKERMEKEN